MPNALGIAVSGRVEYLPHVKSKAYQATIGLCESTAAGGGLTAGGGAGTYSLCQHRQIGEEGGDGVSVHPAACSQPSLSVYLFPRPQSQPRESHIL